MDDFDEDDPFSRILNRIFGGMDYGAYKYSEKNGFSNGFVDIFEDEDHLYITAEIKVQDEDLEVKPREDAIVIEIMSKGRWIRKSIGLPHSIIPDTAEIKFNGGVLDIKVEKVKNAEKIDT